jgi:hypothetical protein
MPEGRDVAAEVPVWVAPTAAIERPDAAASRHVDLGSAAPDDTGRGAARGARRRVRNRPSAQASPYNTVSDHISMCCCTASESALACQRAAAAFPRATSTKVAVFEPAMAAPVGRRQPVPSDHDQQDVARRHGPFDLAHEIHSGRDRIHVHEQLRVRNLVNQTVVQASGRPTAVLAPVIDEDARAHARILHYFPNDRHTALRTPSSSMCLQGCLCCVRRVALSVNHLTHQRSGPR